MTIAQQVTSVGKMREAAVAEAVDKVRVMEREQGVNRGTLEDIKTVLKELAARNELFPAGDFPIVIDDRGQNPIYRLSEDEDHTFALYMTTSRGAKKVPPHNHTTWAVIVGLQGDEENYFYERTDDGSREGQGALRQVGHQTVRAGEGVAMMPEDIHHIETHGDAQTLHFHMYGLALDHLHKRVMYNVDKGTYKMFGASQNIRDLT